MIFSRSFIDRLGQEFCLECACDCLCSTHEQQAVLQKLHLCNCIDQVTGAGSVSREDLTNKVIPSLIGCIAAMSGGENIRSSTESDRLREALTHLVVRLQSSLSSVEASAFLDCLVRFVTADGCGKQQGLVAILARFAKAAAQACEAVALAPSAACEGSVSVLCCLCRDHGPFLQRLLHSALACPTADHPLCDVLFLLATAANIGLMGHNQSRDLVHPRSPLHSHQHADDASGESEESYSHLVMSQRFLQHYGIEHRASDRDDQFSLFPLRCCLQVAASCVISSSSSLVEHLEKFGHVGCWTNALALLSTLAASLEINNSMVEDEFADGISHGQAFNGVSSRSTGVLLDDPQSLASALEALVLGTHSAKNRGYLGDDMRVGPSAADIRLGSAARALLVRSESPAAVCGAAKLFCILSRWFSNTEGSRGGDGATFPRTVKSGVRSSSECTRVLLRDGVAEFAIAGLNTRGSVSSALMRRALSELLDALSERDPIAFFHPSHFHPFALNALLNTLDPHPPKRSGTGLGRTKSLPQPLSGGIYFAEFSTIGSEGIESSSVKSAGSGDWASIVLPLLRLLRRAVEHSSVVDHTGVSNVATVLARTLLLLAKNLSKFSQHPSLRPDVDAAAATEEALCEALQTWGRILAMDTCLQTVQSVESGHVDEGNCSAATSSSQTSSAIDPMVQSPLESSVEFSSALVHQVLSAVFSTSSSMLEDRTRAAALLTAALWLGECDVGSSASENPSSCNGNSDDQRRVVDGSFGGDTHGRNSRESWSRERDTISSIVFGAGSTFSLFDVEVGTTSCSALALLISVVLSGNKSEGQLRGAGGRRDEFGREFARHLVERKYLVQLLVALSHATSALFHGDDGHDGASHVAVGGDHDDARGSVDGNASVFLRCLLAITGQLVPSGWPVIDGFRALALECSAIACHERVADETSERILEQVYRKLIEVIRDSCAQSGVSRGRLAHERGSGHLACFSGDHLDGGIDGLVDEEDELMGNAVEAAILVISLSPVPSQPTLSDLDAALASFIFSHFSTITLSKTEQFNMSVRDQYNRGVPNRCSQRIVINPAASSLRAGVRIIDFMGALISQNDFYLGYGCDQKECDGIEDEQNSSSSSSRRSVGVTKYHRDHSRSDLSSRGWLPSTEFMRGVQFFIVPALAALVAQGPIQSEEGDLKVSNPSASDRIRGACRMREYHHRSTLDALLHGPNPPPSLNVLINIATNCVAGDFSSNSSFPSNSSSEMYSCLRQSPQRVVWGVNNVSAEAAGTLLWDWCRGLFRQFFPTLEASSTVGCSNEGHGWSCQGIVDQVSQHIAVTLKWQNSEEGRHHRTLNPDTRTTDQRIADTIERASVANAVLQGLLLLSKSVLSASPASTTDESAVLWELTFACELVTRLVGPFNSGDSDSLKNDRRGSPPHGRNFPRGQCSGGMAVSGNSWDTLGERYAKAWPMSNDREVQRVHEFLASCHRHSSKHAPLTSAGDGCNSASDCSGGGANSNVCTLLCPAAARMVSSLILRQCAEAPRRARVASGRTKAARAPAGAASREATAVSKSKDRCSDEDPGYAYDPSRSFAPLEDESEIEEEHDSVVHGKEESATGVVRGEVAGLSHSVMAQCAPLLLALACGDGDLEDPAFCPHPVGAPSTTTLSTNMVASECFRTACLSALNGIAALASSAVADGHRSRGAWLGGSNGGNNDVDVAIAQSTLRTLRTSQASKVGSLLTSLLSDEEAGIRTSPVVQDPVAFCAAAATFLLLTSEGVSDLTHAALPDRPPISAAILLAIVDPTAPMSSTASKVTAEVRRCSDWEGHPEASCRLWFPTSRAFATSMTLVASCFHLATRLLYNDHILTGRMSSLGADEGPASSSKPSSSSSAHVSGSSALGVWWWVGPRDRERFACAAHHWALSTTPAVAEAAMALLLLLRYTAPQPPPLALEPVATRATEDEISPSKVTQACARDISWCEGWHRVVVEETLASLSLQLQHESDGGRFRRRLESEVRPPESPPTPMPPPGPFALLFLAMTAQKIPVVPWVAPAFRNALRLSGSSAEGTKRKANAPNLHPNPSLCTARDWTMKLVLSRLDRDESRRYPAPGSVEVASFVHLASVLRQQSLLDPASVSLPKKHSPELESSYRLSNCFHGSWISVTPALSLPHVDWASGLALPPTEDPDETHVIHPAQVHLR